MTRITRRSLLRTAGLGGALLLPAAPLAGIARAGRVDTYTGVTYLTPAYQDMMGGITGFLERLRQGAGGRFAVDFFDSGTLVTADEQVSALRARTIDFMFHTTSYITRSFEILGITGLPGLVEVLYQHGERLAMESPLWTLMNDRLARNGLFMLTAGGGILEPEYVWSSTNKVTSLADLSGKRCRMVSYEANRMLESFGAAGVRVPSSETYLALQRGTVDAVIANISTVMARRLHEQVRHCYRLSVTAFSNAILLLKPTWDGFDGATRAAFWEAAKWYDETYAREINTVFYPQRHWPAVAAAGIEVTAPTEEDRRRFAESSLPVWAWWEDQVGAEVGRRAIDLALGQA